MWPMYVWSSVRPLIVNEIYNINLLNRNSCRDQWIFDVGIHTTFMVSRFRNTNVPNWPSYYQCVVQMTRNRMVHDEHYWLHLHRRKKSSLNYEFSLPLCDINYVGTKYYKIEYLHSKLLPAHKKEYSASYGFN